MKRSEAGPLDSEIEALLDAERPIPSAPAGAAAQVRAALDSSLAAGVAPVLFSASSVPALLSAKGVLGLATALVVASGLGAWQLARREIPERPLPAPIGATSSQDPASAPESVPPDEVAAPPASPLIQAPTPTPEPPAPVGTAKPRATAAPGAQLGTTPPPELNPSSPPPVAVDPPPALTREESTPAPALEPDRALREERQVLELARTALSRGEFSGAYAALDLHRQRFPGGQLAEERDSLMVLVLSANGLAAEARARAEAFRRQHPDSIFGPSVDLALENSPTDSGLPPQ